MALSFKRITTGKTSLVASAAMLREAFPGVPFAVELLSWQYAENPVGPVVGFEAWEGGSIVAHYACQPVTAIHEGRSETGLLSLNTATLPSHQGRGLFSQLASATYETAKAEGFTFVIGVANANSTPGFTRRLGFQLVGKLDARIGLGLPAPVRPHAAFERSWDAESLHWRLRHPHRRYMIRGSRIWSDTGTPFVRALLAADLIPDRDVQSVLEASLGWRPLTLWLGIEPGGIRPAAAVDIPSRFRPSPLNLIYLDLRQSGRTLDKVDVRFRCLDFDAY